MKMKRHQIVVEIHAQLEKEDSTTEDPCIDDPSLPECSQETETNSEEDPEAYEEDEGYEEDYYYE